MASNPEKAEIRAYLSNIVRIWPVDEQERVHAAGTPGWPNVAIYRDEVKPAWRRAHSAEALIQRGFMLRKTSRRGGAERIYVAALCVMAWSSEDWMHCMAALDARNATVIALDTGREIPPGATQAQRAEAFSEFLAGRRRAQTGESRKVGAKISAERKKADSARRADLIRADWPLRIVSTKDLLLRAGTTRKGGGRERIVPMAYSIAKRHLGPRPEAQEAHERALAREARKRELEQEARRGRRKHKA
jgi:hypothetical protein